MIVDSEPKFYVNNKEMKASEIGINNNYETLHLKYILNIFNTVKVCHGIKISKNIGTYFGTQYIELNGHWKHTNCLNTIEDKDRY